MLTVTKENLHREVLLAGGPVLLEFWAAWDPVSRSPSPALSAMEARPGVTVGRVNVDDAPEIANRFVVRSVPTLIVLRGGRETGRLVGRYVGRQIEQLL